jgi:hypothetical protein
MAAAGRITHSPRTSARARPIGCPSSISVTSAPGAARPAATSMPRAPTRTTSKRGGSAAALPAPDAPEASATATPDPVAEDRARGGMAAAMETGADVAAACTGRVAGAARSRRTRAAPRPPPRTPRTSSTVMLARWLAIMPS